MIEDKLIVRRLNRGDKDALSRVYEKYRDDLLRLAAALLNDTAGAEDIVQDVFVTFARVARTFRLTGTLRGYLATCVANAARNKNKASNRRRPLGPDTTEDVPTDSYSPERWIICSEEFKRLSNIMAQLPYEQREVVTLHLYAAMTFRHIARLQKTSIKTTQSRYAYGLKKMRSMLDGEAPK